MTASQIWLIIIGIMIFVEIITVGNLISIWFALGAISALLSAQFTDNMIIQAIIFCTTSLLSLLIIRPLTTKLLQGKQIATNSDSLIGRTFTLTEGISSEQNGTLTVNGSGWSAITSDGHSIDKNSKVRVIAIEGNKLIVQEVFEH